MIATSVPTAGTPTECVSLARSRLAELARLNSDVVPLAMRIMGNNATSDEQHTFAHRLVAMAQRLHARASVAVIEGNVVTVPDNETPRSTG